MNYQIRRTLHAAKDILADGSPITLLRRLKSAFGVAGLAFRGELTVAYCTLEARVTRADGTVENLGVISRRKVSAHFVQQITGCLADATQTDEKWTSLALYKFMGCGTDATAEGANGADYKLNAEVTDNARTSGVVTDVSVHPAGKFQVVGTYTFTGSHAITEFGLFTGTDRNTTTINGAQAANTTPLAITSSAGWASSGDAFCQGQVIKYTGTAAGQLTGCTQGNAAITLANSRGIAAAGMLDRKVFAAINVASGDSIQFTYTVTVNPET